MSAARKAREAPRILPIGTFYASEFALSTLPVGPVRRTLESGRVETNMQQIFRVLVLSSTWALGASALVYGVTNWNECRNVLYVATTWLN